MLGVLGFLVLVALPGTWVTFGLPLGGLPAWARLLTGAVLSPAVVLVQFYVCRLLGASYETTVLLLVGLNLPALFLVLRRFGRPTFPERRAVWAVAVVLLITLASLGQRLVDTQDRVYTGHMWVHADVAYAVADGELRPEEPLLAGVGLAYPWSGHVYLAVLSDLLDSPPVASHLWISLLWMLLVCGFAVGITAELGVRGDALISSIVWLLFGVNVVGSVMEEVLSKAAIQDFPVWGDPRYTPWVSKFLFPNAMPFALGMFAALTYLMVRRRPGDLSVPSLVVIALLLCGVGVVYPILAPTAFGVVGARVIAEIVAARRGHWTEAVRPVLVLGALLATALAVTFVHLDFATRDRVTESLALSDPKHAFFKIVTGLVVCAPLLVGLGVTFGRCWGELRSATIVLVMGGLASLGVHALIHIPHWENEYKFIYTAAVCLMPFPALALQPVFRRLGRLSLPVLGVMTALLAAPLAVKVYLHPHWGVPPWGRPADRVPPGRPVVDIGSFDLKLDAGERAAAMCESIRTETPPTTVLVTSGAGLHLPTLTRRHLYYPPNERAHYGINRTAEYVLQSWRGYDPDLIGRRKAVLVELYRGVDESRASALEEILALGRPVALVLDVDPPRSAQTGRSERQAQASREANRQLLEWLRKETGGRVVHDDEGFVVWLIPAPVKA